jgi:hypothetical protein
MTGGPSGRSRTVGPVAPGHNTARGFAVAWLGSSRAGTGPSVRSIVRVSMMSRSDRSAPNVAIMPKSIGRGYSSLHSVNLRLPSAY